MALTFPLTAAQFVDLLTVVSSDLHLGEALQSSQTGAGEVIMASLGERLWQGTVTLAPGYHHAAAQQNVMLNMLREPGRSFFIYDKTLQYPAADPGAVILGSATPTIGSLPSSREIAIAGLPASYTLTPGDRLAFPYGSTPTRYALHQVVVGGTSDSSGNLTVEVTPSVRAGAANGAAITLARPAMKAIIVPNSIRHGQSTGRITTGASFKIIQTLR